MAVTAIKRAAESASGAHGRNAEHRYTAPYIVTTDSAADGPHEIAIWFEANGYPIGSTYAYGGDVDPSSYLASITPTRIPGSLLQWQVVLTYEPPSRSDPQTADGEPTSDPLSWELEVDISTATYQLPVWQAWNVDAFPLGGGAGYTRAANTLGAVVNSAGVVLDPPLMRDQPEVTLRVAGYVAYGALSYVDDFVGKLNAEPLSFDPFFCAAYHVTAQDFGVHTLKCTGLTHAYRRLNGIQCWHLGYELKYRPVASATNPQDRWYEAVLDRGVSRRAGAGDPDGKGSIISPSDVVAGMAVNAPIRDLDGSRVPELVLLDGRGQPAQADSAGVFFRWRVDGEALFSWLPFDVFAEQDA